MRDLAKGDIVVDELGMELEVTSVPAVVDGAMVVPRRIKLTPRHAGLTIQGGTAEDGGCALVATRSDDPFWVRVVVVTTLSLLVLLPLLVAEVIWMVWVPWLVFVGLTGLLAIGGAKGLAAVAAILSGIGLALSAGMALWLRLADDPFSVGSRCLNCSDVWWRVGGFLALWFGPAFIAAIVRLRRLGHSAHHRP